MSKVEILTEALEEARDVLDDYSDVDDGNDGRQGPNKAMAAVIRIDEALERARKAVL